MSDAGVTARPNAAPSIGTGQTGMAGEHFVTGELLRRGWLAAMVNGNSPRLDILASKGSRTIQIQVKARSEGAKGDTSLPQAKFAPHIYYIIVDLRPEGADYYIVPGYELDRFYYRSPCGIRGRIPSSQLGLFKSRWDLLDHEYAHG
jgi:hypothetical protein